MKRTLTFLCALAPLATPVYANDLYHGSFIHYEGGEYESTFVPCKGKEVWSIAEGPEQQTLVALAFAQPNKEIAASLVLEVTPIDRSKYPQSHYTGTAKVLQIEDTGHDKCAHK